ncbi:hypothetical protein CER19_02690 [Pseudomonas sp. GL93]|nr:hypothetical protein CER19_02690 [Pseudomonas sp. GL93]
MGSGDKERYCSRGGLYRVLRDDQICTTKSPETSDFTLRKSLSKIWFAADFLLLGHLGKCGQNL